VIERTPPAATSPLHPAERPSQAARSTTATFAGELDAAIPATPPAEVLADLDKAGRVLNELSDKNVKVRFDIDEAQRVQVTMTDEHGNVLRKIPATGLLDALAGRGLSLDTTA
jgi:uncharacterized FlaG/YvyC family protein